MNFSAVILAGGKSLRMGCDKAWLEIEGQTLLARQIALARETGAAEIFIAGRSDTDYSSFGCRVLPDKFFDAGPLAGIERALAAANETLLLVLAVDLPQMKAESLIRVAQAVRKPAGPFRDWQTASNRSRRFIRNPLMRRPRPDLHAALSP